MNRKVAKARVMTAIIGLCMFSTATITLFIIALIERKPIELLFVLLGALEAGGFGWYFAWTRGKLIRANRAAAGACLKCGYDLRETRSKCPECGTIPIHLKEP